MRYQVIYTPLRPLPPQSIWKYTNIFFFHELLFSLIFPTVLLFIFKGSNHNGSAQWPKNTLLTLEYRLLPTQADWVSGLILFNYKMGDKTVSTQSK